MAATVMLGVAAERVFLLLCEALVVALADAAEKRTFQNRLDKRPMKPKLDWVNQKFQAICAPGFPDNAAIMVTAVYDLLRFQRNELGHPRANPPNIDRRDAFVNIQVFARYYVVAEQVREFLESTQV